MLDDGRPLDRPPPAAPDRCPPRAGVAERSAARPPFRRPPPVRASRELTQLPAKLADPGRRPLCDGHASWGVASLISYADGDFEGRIGDWASVPNSTDALADRWGHGGDEPGRVVWLEMAVRPETDGGR
ncbi:MAG: hypothetical protein ACLP70_08015 [Streptosporangiaceae bacterium]